MVSALLDGPVDEELVAEIVQETEGNPFFVEEVIKSLLEQESLGNEAGRWAPLPGLELEVPQSIRITIGQRLARLNKDGSLALTQAAILGRDFDFDLLLAMGEWDEDQLLVALEEIEQAQLATEIRGTTELRYRFGHALVVQVLYEGLNARRRARYHLRAGEAIERVYANRLSDQVEALAHHYSLAPTGAAGKAVDYSLLAAEKAVSVHAHEQAVDHYVNALEALEDLDEPVRKASVLELLGDTHLTTFFVTEAISAYEDALHVLEQAGATGEQAYYRLHAKLGQVMARQRIDPARARAYLNSALERMPEDSPERVKCLAALAQCTGPGAGSTAGSPASRVRPGAGHESVNSLAPLPAPVRPCAPYIWPRATWKHISQQPKGESRPATGMMICTASFWPTGPMSGAAI